MRALFGFTGLGKTEFASLIALRNVARSQTDSSRIGRSGQALQFFPSQTGIIFICSCCLAAVLSGCGGSVTVEQIPGTLAASPTTVAFGNVAVGQVANSTITLRAGSSGPVQISQLSLSGQSFAMSGQSDLPITIAAGGAYDLNVQFDPTATGAVAGQITITNNSSADGTVAIALSGTGTPLSYVASLSWDAPLDSPVPVAGYNVYRSQAGSSKYQLLNLSIDPDTTYIDNSVQNGLTYDYVIESVDSVGVASAPTSPVSVEIP